MSPTFTNYVILILTPNQPPPHSRKAKGCHGLDLLSQGLAVLPSQLRKHDALGIFTGGPLEGVAEVHVSLQRFLGRCDVSTCQWHVWKDWKENKIIKQPWFERNIQQNKQRERAQYIFKERSWGWVKTLYPLWTKMVPKILTHPHIKSRSLTVPQLPSHTHFAPWRRISRALDDHWTFAHIRDARRRVRWSTTPWLGRPDDRWPKAEYLPRRSVECSRWRPG